MASECFGEESGISDGWLPMVQLRLDAAQFPGECGLVNALCLACCPFLIGLAFDLASNKSPT